MLSIFLNNSEIFTAIKKQFLSDPCLSQRVFNKSDNFGLINCYFQINKLDETIWNLVSSCWRDLIYSVPILGYQIEGIVCMSLN